MGFPRTGRGKKRSSQSASQDDDFSPPKRLHLSPKPGLVELDGKALQHIFSYLSLNELSRLAMSSRSLASHVFNFSLSAKALTTLFPSMFTPAAHASQTRYKVEGSPTSLGLDPSSARLNFRRLGELAKRLTCLLPTKERVKVSAQLVGRLSYQESGAAPLMSAIGVFIHALVRGWEDLECCSAVDAILQMFNAEEEQLSELLTDDYILGSRVRQELLARSFLYSVFHQEVAPGVNRAETRRQQRLWIRHLVTFSCPPGRNQVVGVARLLLLMTTPAREQGVQWSDHEEAIPATMAVASARYGLLVSQLHHLSHQPQILPLTDLLAVIFKQPTKWLPENVGSVLLLLGQVATKQFLMQAVIASAEEVAHAFTGLALMTARFRRPFTAVFHRLDEIVEGVEEGEERDAVLSAIWRSLTQEVRELRVAQHAGEDWAEEGGMHIFKVVREVGKRMMEKAYMGMSHNGSNALTNEE